MIKQMTTEEEHHSFDLVSTYEAYINSSRESFELQTGEGRESSVEVVMKFTDELSMRLEYYKEIKRYRAMLRRKAKQELQSVNPHLFDVTLKITYPHASKEFDLMEKNSS